MIQATQEISILYEDDYLIGLNKPAGLIVNRADSVSEKTLQDWFDEHYPLCIALGDDPESTLFKSRSGLVHRLDKDTSGVMLMAKDPITMLELMRQFKQREITKVYKALVHGKLSPKVGDIHLPIARSQINRQQFSVQPFGRPSLTYYKVTAYYESKEAGTTSNQTYSLVSFFPKTGRTHQIRVHSNHLHHPLVADQLYGSKKMLKADSQWCQRQFLHAKEISFAHPHSKELKTITAPMSDDLKLALETRVLCQ